MHQGTCDEFNLSEWVIHCQRLERYTPQHVICTNDLCGRPKHPLECQMSKHKPATASKHARSQTTAAKAQRVTQAIVRSPKDSRLRSVAAISTESPPQRHNDSKQEAPPVENLATALQDDCKQTTTDNDSR